MVVGSLSGPKVQWGCALRRARAQLIDRALFPTHAQIYAQNPVLHLLSDDRAAKFAECLLQLQFDKREERSRVAVAKIL
jgi:hypothetical protein